MRVSERHLLKRNLLRFSDINTLNPGNKLFIISLSMILNFSTRCWAYYWIKIVWASCLNGHKQTLQLLFPFFCSSIKCGRQLKVTIFFWKIDCYFVQWRKMLLTLYPRSNQQLRNSVYALHDISNGYPERNISVSTI